MANEYQLGGTLIEDAYRAMMNDIAKELDKILNGDLEGSEKDTGFVLLVFPFGDHEGRCNYISNGANKKDIVTIMKEQIARFEGQPEIEGSA